MGRRFGRRHGTEIEVAPRRRRWRASPYALLLAVGLWLPPALAGAAAPDDAGPIVLEEPEVEVSLPPGIDAADVAVFVDGALASDFVTPADGALRLTVPFPDAITPFVVTLRDPETGEVLQSQSYRMGAEKAFDRADADLRFQTDTIFTPKAGLHPQTKSFESSNAQNNSTASLDLEVGRGGWSFGGTGEVTTTSEKTERFRTDGPLIDLAELNVFADYQSDLVRGRFEYGDVTAFGNNPLVNEGFDSRGATVDFGMFDDRVRLFGARTFGTDIAGTSNYPGFQQDSNRTAVNLDVDVLSSSLAAVSLRGTYYDMERPDDSNFKETAADVGERNVIWGAGSTFTFFDERIAFSSDFARSNYENPDALDFGVTDFEGNVINFGDISGSAFNHRLDVTIWDADDLRVTGYGGVSRVDPLFQAIDTAIYPDRRTYIFGGSVEYAPVTFSYSSEAFDTNIDDLPGLLSTRESTDSAVLELDLADYRESGIEDGSSGLARALPSSLAFETKHWRVKGTNGEALIQTPGIFFTADLIPNESSESYGLAAEWDFDPLSFELGVERIYVNDRSIGNGDVDSLENAIELGFDYRTGVFSIGGAGEFALIDNTERDAPATDYEAGAELDVALRLEGLPDLLARGDVAWFLTEGQDDPGDSRELSYSASGTVDFSKYLPEVFPGLEAYLHSTFQYQNTVTKDGFFGTSNQIDWSWIVAFGVGY